MVQRWSLLSRTQTMRDHAPYFIFTSWEPGGSWWRVWLVSCHHHWYWSVVTLSPHTSHTPTRLQSLISFRGDERMFDWIFNLAEVWEPESYDLISNILLQFCTGHGDDIVTGHENSRVLIALENIFIVYDGWWALDWGMTVLYGEHISHGHMLSWYHGPMPVYIKGQMAVTMLCVVSFSPASITPTLSHTKIHSCHHCGSLKGCDDCSTLESVSDLSDPDYRRAVTKSYKITRVPYKLSRGAAW